MMTSNAPEYLSDYLKDAWTTRAAKREELRALGFDPYENSFFDNRDILPASEIHVLGEELAPGEANKAGKAVAMGRIRAIRNSGLFIDIEDASGRVQCFFHKDNLDAAALAAVKLLDLGDIIGIAGIVRRTPRGEITINAHEIGVLSKALLPLPDKRDGLQDPETRLRKRHLDFIANPIARDALRMRSRIIHAIRRLLDARGFMEVETPVLMASAGGAAATPFRTHHDALGQDMFLRIAPELHLKRLLIGGVAEQIYEIGRNFRNEGLSSRHNPEFTSLEAYQTGATYHDGMELVSTILLEAAAAIGAARQIRYGEHSIEIPLSIPSISMAEAVLLHTKLDFRAMTDEEALSAARGDGIELPAGSGWGKALAAVFEKRVEGRLIQPIHITGFPAEVSPLARRSEHDSRLTDRFETYIAGMEIANGFSELTDPEEQMDRFLAQAGKDAHPADTDFVEALAHGMPPSSGLGIGLDRLAMLFCNMPHIRDVIAFPALRHKE